MFRTTIWIDCKPHDLSRSGHDLGLDLDLGQIFNMIFLSQVIAHSTRLDERITRLENECRVFTESIVNENLSCVSLRGPGAELEGSLNPPPPPSGGGKSRGPAGCGLTWSAVTRPSP